MIIVLVEFVLPSYAVTLTTYVFAGRESVEGRSALAYSTTEFRYAIAALVMTLSFGAATIGILAMLSMFRAPVPSMLALALVWIVAALFIATRLILLFPAIAAGGSASPRIAWQTTRRNFWRLALIAILTAIPYSIITTLIRVAAGSIAGPASRLVLAAILSAIVTLSWTTTLAWQALAYKQLSGSSDTFASTSRAV